VNKARNHRVNEQCTKSDCTPIQQLVKPHS